MCQTFLGTHKIVIIHTNVNIQRASILRSAEIDANRYDVVNHYSPHQYRLWVGRI